jgi:glutaredoxin
MVELTEKIGMGTPENRYKILFSGKVAKGRDPYEVKRNLKSLFKVGDSKIEQLFSGKVFVIKDSVDYESAMKYQMAFETAGAVCKVKEISPGLTMEYSDETKNMPSSSDEQAMMTCPKCDFEQKEAKECIRCGIVINKYSGEAEDTPQDPPTVTRKNKKPLYFPVSKLKLILMSLFTFGLYEVYWFYKNWKLIKTRTGQNLSPFWRAFFSIIFCYPLFKHIQASADSQGCKSNINPGWLLIGYIALNVTWRLPDPFFIISLLTFLPLLSVQGVINDLNLKTAPHAERNSRFSITNFAVIIIGGFFVILGAVGSLIPSSFDTENDQLVRGMFSKFGVIQAQEEGDSDSYVDVVIYTTPRCGYCNLAKSFFRKHDINYFEYDISTSEEGRQEYQELNGRGVPLIFVGDTRMDGYNERYLKSVLKKEGIL